MPAPARMHIASHARRMAFKLDRRYMGLPSVKHLKEVRKLQKMVEPLLKKTPFDRIVREIVQDLRCDYHAGKGGNAALREAADKYMHWLMETVAYAAEHRGRQTITVEDMRLVLAIAKKDRPVTFN